MKLYFCPRCHRRIDKSLGNIKLEKKAKIIVKCGFCKKGQVELKEATENK